MSRHFRTTCPLRSQVFRLTEANSVRPDTPRTSPGNETVKLSRRQTVETEWPSWTWCRTWWHYSWDSHIKSTLFCIRSSAHSSGVKTSCNFANSELQRRFWLLPVWTNWAPHIPRRLIGRQFCNFSIRRIIRGPGWRAEECKRKFLIREYSPEKKEHCRGSYGTPVLAQSTCKISN